jgi:hypothetical protein
MSTVKATDWGFSADDMLISDDVKVLSVNSNYNPVVLISFNNPYLT